ncbi:MAG TPA: methyltransferase domain-containing protein [Solirubrobacterales bacterium]|nr:methyltransferase domain-containing protein [Solirubrobacterales bacterium]
MSADSHREASREQWGSSAEVWARAAEEEETGASASATEWMLAAAGLRPGERVLELACGAARVGFHAADAVRPGGSVLCSDFAEEMVQAVESRVARTGVENVEPRVLDAERLDLDDESFDAVLCRFGYMLMSNPARAMTESRRVLRPGGRLVLAVWGAPERNPWLTAVTDATMDRLGAPPPEPGTPGPFALGEPERLRELLAGAALEEIDVEAIDAEQPYDSLEGWWLRLREISGPLAALLDALPAEDAAAIKSAALSTAERYVKPGGEVVFPATILGAKAHASKNSPA